MKFFMTSVSIFYAVLATVQHANSVLISWVVNGLKSNDFKVIFKHWYTWTNQRTIDFGQWREILITSYVLFYDTALMKA